MSKGLGELQRWLLAVLQGRQKEAITARDLTAQRLDELGISSREANRRWRATSSAVRRALRGLAKTGRIVRVERGGGGGPDRHVAYSANEAVVAEQQRKRTDDKAAAARLATMGQPRPQPAFDTQGEYARQQTARQEADRQANEARLKMMKEARRRQLGE